MRHIFKKNHSSKLYLENCSTDQFDPCDQQGLRFFGKLKSKFKNLSTPNLWYSMYER